MMNKEQSQELFQRIAVDAVSAAEKVKCSGQDFVSGLKTIVNEVTNRLEMAQDEFGKDES